MLFAGLPGSGLLSAWLPAHQLTQSQKTFLERKPHGHPTVSNLSTGLLETQFQLLGSFLPVYVVNLIFQTAHSSRSLAGALLPDLRPLLHITQMDVRRVCTI